MAHIFGFWGLAGLAFSDGVFKLADQLREDGHEVHVYAWAARGLAQRKALKVKGPIGAYGHSLGANAAANFVRNLQGKKDILGVSCIDPTGAKPLKGIPGFSFGSSDFRLNHVEGLLPMDYPNLNHLQIDNEPEVFELTRKLFSA